MKPFHSQWLLFFVVFFCSIVFAQDTINVPAECPTIQAGIYAASNGDLVLVAEGTYFENINFIGKAITVASLFINDDSTKYISNTIINGSQPNNPDSGSVVYFISGEDTNSILCGFTITGGTGTLWGSNSRSGGGIACRNSDAKIIWNIIENNHVVSNTPTTPGGGISGGPQNDNSWIIIENNIIRNNSVTNTAPDGEAIGGGISLVENARIINNIIEFNIAEATYGTPHGGGVGLVNHQYRDRFVIGNKICNNKAIAPTGIAMDGGLGGGLFIGDMPRSEIRSNDIRYNAIEGNVNLSIVSWGGGVILVNQNNETIFTQNYVADNYVLNNSLCYGAGMAIWNYDITGGPQITNNIITNNTNGTRGGGIFIGGYVFNNPSFINNTICNNSALSGDGIYIGEDASHPSHPVIINSIIWDGNSSIYLNDNSTVDVVYSDIEGDTTGLGNIGNISLDPFFSDTLFHLEDWSPCIGAGIDSIEIGGVWYYAPPNCYFGGSRPNPPGSMPDMGACESPLPDPIPVELISFSGLVEGHDVILTWNTATEVNNQRFEIQRKTDGEFERVGFVEGKGTTTEVQNYIFRDEDLFSGNYSYRLKQIDFDGTFAYSNEVSVEISQPSVFVLGQNYPNPFNPVTSIQYALGSRQFVSLKVYDILGNEIITLVNEELPAGEYKIEFDAVGTSRDLSLTSGVYFYQLKAGEFIDTKKMLLLK